MSRFAWTEQTEKAALLLAKADLTKTEIAETLGISRPTLSRWENNPKFKLRVDELLTEIRREIFRIGIADQVKRVQSQNNRWRKLHQVIEARADSPEMKDVPGGHTGLLAKTVKGIGRGEDFQVIELFEVDTGLLREIREVEKQAAQELGQWVVKTEDVAKPADVDPAAAERAMNAAAEAPENTDEP